MKDGAVATLRKVTSIMCLDSEKKQRQRIRNKTGGNIRYYTE